MIKEPWKPEKPSLPNKEDLEGCRRGFIYIFFLQLSNTVSNWEAMWGDRKSIIHYPGKCMKTGEGGGGRGGRVCGCECERLWTWHFIALRDTPVQWLSPRQVKRFGVNPWLCPWLPVCSRVPHNDNHFTQSSTGTHWGKLVKASLKFSKWEHIQNSLFMTRSTHRQLVDQKGKENCICWVTTVAGACVTSTWITTSPLTPQLEEWITLMGSHTTVLISWRNAFNFMLEFVIILQNWSDNTLP